MIRSIKKSGESCGRRKGSQTHTCIRNPTCIPNVPANHTAPVNLDTPSLITPLPLFLDAHSFIHSLIHSFTHSSIHSSIHSFTHPFIHSFIHSSPFSILSPLHLLLALVMAIELASCKTFGKHVLGWDHWSEAHRGWGGVLLILRCIFVAQHPMIDNEGGRGKGGVGHRQGKFLILTKD